MTVAIFDDHPFYAQSLAAFLTKCGYQVLFISHTIDSVFENLKQYQPDFLISDVLTEEERGLELFEKIQNPEIPIIVYSSITSEFVHQCLYQLGVKAIINKKDSPDKILPFLEKNNSPSSSSPGILPDLTEKEHQIAKLLAKGFSAKEIATLTDSSPNTINNQKNHLLTKFDCQNTTELVTKLLLLGFLKI